MSQTLYLCCGRVPAANAHWMHCSRRLIVQTLVFSRSYLLCQVSPPETLVVKGRTDWPINDRWILSENARLPRNIQGSFTCRKSTTWDKRLYFPSEGSRAEDFFSPWKNRRLRPGLNPRTWVPKASTLPLDHRSRPYTINDCFSFISRFHAAALTWFPQQNSAYILCIRVRVYYKAFLSLWRTNPLLEGTVAVLCYFVSPRSQNHCVCVSVIFRTISAHTSSLPLGLSPRCKWNLPFSLMLTTFWDNQWVPSL